MKTNTKMPITIAGTPFRTSRASVSTFANRFGANSFR
jgi:hypothetical protein